MFSIDVVVKFTFYFSSVLVTEHVCCYSNMLDAIDKLIIAGTSSLASII